MEQNYWILVIGLKIKITEYVDKGGGLPNLIKNKDCYMLKYDYWDGNSHGNL